MPFDDKIKLIKKNLTALLISEMLTRVMMLVFTIILARTYGKEQFGVYALALSIGGLFEIFFNMGLNTVFIQRVVGEKKPLQEELSTFLPLRILLSLASFACFIVFIILMGKNAATMEALALGGLYYTIASMVGFLWASFDAKQQMQYTAGIKLFQHIIIFVLGMFFIYYGYSISTIVGTYVIAICLAGLATIIIIHKYFTHIRPRIMTQKWKEIIHKGWPIALSGAFVFVYSYLDTIIISLNQGEQAVGLYQASYKIIGTLFILSSIINQAYFPSLIESHHQDKDKLQHIFDKTLKSVFFWSIPISIGGAMLSERIILFIFGPEYTGAIAVFTILIWNCIIYFASSAMTTLLYALGKQRETLKVFFIGAAVNTALNLYIIPKYGIEGAAITTLAAESAVLIGIYLLVKNHIKVKIIKHIWMPLVSAAFMALALSYINIERMAAVLTTINLVKPLFGIFESLILTVAFGGAVYFIVYFGLKQTSSKARTHLNKK